MTNIEILKDGAIYVGGVLNQEATKKNRTFLREKLEALLGEIDEEIENYLLSGKSTVGNLAKFSEHRIPLLWQLGLRDAQAIIESKKK